METKATAEPFFCLVTITLNNAQGLKTTARSVLQQTERDFAWIIVDGGSSDESADYAARHLVPAGALWHSAPDNGIYDAMNKGLALARSGQYVLFLNAGDALACPDTLARLKAAITAAGDAQPDFVYGDSIEKTGAGLRPKRARPLQKKSLGMFTHHQAMLYRRAALGSLRYDTSLKIAADYDFTLRFLLHRPRSIFYWPEPVCLFQSGGISQQNAALGRAEQFKVRQALNLVPGWKNHLIRAAQHLNWWLRRLGPGFYWLWKSPGNRQPCPQPGRNLPAHPENRP